MTEPSISPTVDPAWDAVKSVGDPNVVAVVLAAVLEAHRD